ncbi:MAG: hypothetical protein IKZ76_02780 [Lachnospiraceae bacterium]|nr:hypothetical protein [Lachnospiraceae bacterium]MBR5916983.1 hypothetical protein [Lachnospiraceae bacterium]
MIYLEEKKYFSVVLIIVAGLFLATFFLINKPQILLPVFAAGFIILAFFGAFFIRKVYKKAIKAEQYLDQVISNEGNLSITSNAEKDSIFANIIEELKELEKIRQSQESEKNKELLWQKNLMSDISHQIKTPLATLEIYTDIFNKEFGENEEKRELSEHAKEAIERIRWLVTGMLQIAKLESGTYKMEKKESPVRETIDRALYSLNSLISEKKINVRIEERKEENREIIIPQDSKWLEEAFINIIKNALEYSPEEGNLDIFITDTPMAVSVEVKDYGEGISEEEIPKIFNRFYKVSGQREKRKDSVGIGLNLSKEIVKAHNGIITAESRRGNDSFTSIYTTFLR